MLRTILTIGLLAIAGLFVLKLVFGVLGLLFGAFGMLLVLAIRIALVGALIYFVIRLVSPDTARRMRDRFNC